MVNCPKVNRKNLSCLKPSYQQKKEPVFWEAWNKSGDVVFEAGCHVFGARYYDPVLGRWHSQDPMSQYASPYNAMGNNPVNLIDRWGMCASSPEGGGGASSGGMPSWCDGYSSNWFGLPSYCYQGYATDDLGMPGDIWAAKSSQTTNATVRYYLNTKEIHTVHMDGRDEVTSSRSWITYEIDWNSVSNTSIYKNGEVVYSVNSKKRGKLEGRVTPKGDKPLSISEFKLPELNISKPDREALLAVSSSLVLTGVAATGEVPMVAAGAFTASFVINWTLWYDGTAEFVNNSSKTTCDWIRWSTNSVVTYGGLIPTFTIPSAAYSIIDEMGIINPFWNYIDKITK